MTTLLSKSNGTTETFQNTDLAAILTSLGASDNTFQEANGVAFVRINPLKLLLLDVDGTWLCDVCGRLLCVVLLEFHCKFSDTNGIAHG